MNVDPLRAGSCGAVGCALAEEGHLDNDGLGIRT